MKLLQRIQDMVFKPRATWMVIEQERASIASIYTNYLVYLAAIPLVVGLIELFVMGVGVRGTRIGAPVPTSAWHLVVSYGLSLLAVLLLALVVDALAPVFGGSKSRLNAFKLVAFAATASFAARLFDLMPTLGFLAWFGSLYSIYLVYTGAPVLMKCPPKRAALYTAAVVVCGFLAMLLLGATASAVLPRNSGLLDETVGKVRTDHTAVNLPTQTVRSHAPCAAFQWSV